MRVGGTGGKSGAWLVGQGNDPARKKRPLHGRIATRTDWLINRRVRWPGRRRRRGLRRWAVRRRFGGRLELRRSARAVCLGLPAYLPARSLCPPRCRIPRRVDKLPPPGRFLR
uniref:Uncharacterized protein n=1 Tax=Plectus sambesii TaxID=2011161 RepID=A0A914X5I4_9BILA